MAVVTALACVFSSAFCSAATPGSEPNAAELVRVVRQSENWLHQIDSLQLRIEGKWSRSPESIAARYAELKKESPDREPDPNSNWDLKPSESDVLEYAIDFSGKRFRYVKSTPGRDHYLKIWDGKQSMGYSDLLQQYYLDSTMKSFETIFGSLSWPRAQPHSFWWEPVDVEQRMHWYGREKDFVMKGGAGYRAIPCYVLEYTPPNEPNGMHQWYVGVKDHLLYGRKEWINPDFVFEYWTLDYKQVAPGCWMPMTQGYSMPGHNPDTEQHYVRAVRDVRIVEARVNDKLSDELFQMKFEEGLTVIDHRSGKSVVYNYVPTLPSLIGHPFPEMDGLGIDIAPGGVDNKAMLLCFFDMNQRPSRHCIVQLAEQMEQLEEKSVAIVAVQVSEVDENVLNEWVKKNKVPFPIGMVQGDEKGIRLAWGVKSLPWLILADSEQVVRAEGFELIELAARIEEINNK
ncbi:MAG: hypothetical protein P8Z79_11890 [Sedimentisphaerales bacterium]